jgi:hypothetical protein
MKPNYTTHVHMSMKRHVCWNKLDINGFWPRGNNDMMQCVKCNESSLFTQSEGKQMFPITNRKPPFFNHNVLNCMSFSTTIYHYLIK